MQSTAIESFRSERAARGRSWLRAVLGLQRPASQDEERRAERAAALRPATDRGAAAPEKRGPPHVHRFDATGWGHTVLVDSDGHGVIQVGEVVLADCAPVAKAMWVDASRDFCLFTIKRKSGCTDLVICRRDDPAGGSILVHDWSPSRNLGICLGR